MKRPRRLGARPAAEQRADYDARRSAAKPWRTWYNTMRWRRRRAQQLLEEPLCRIHARQGRVAKATVADHVVPHRGDEGLFWDGELQSLCAPCHNSLKQREERGGVAG